jgi:hypothetical protein
MSDSTNHPSDKWRKSAPMPTDDDVEAALRHEYGGTPTTDALIDVVMPMIRARSIAPSAIGTVDPAIAFNDWWDREVEGGLMLSAPRLKETAWRAWQASSGTSRPSREY